MIVVESYCLKRSDIVLEVTVFSCISLPAVLEGRFLSILKVSGITLWFMKCIFPLNGDTVN